jgi:hypothetical protein
VKLQTANGIVTATHQAKVKIMELDLTLWAIILADSPCLISMGKLCRECGFTFKQEGANTPVLQKGRLKVECQTVYDVPFITPFGPSEARGNPEEKFKEDLASSEKAPEEIIAEGNFEAPDQRGSSSKPEEKDDEPPETHLNQKVRPLG